MQPDSIRRVLFVHSSNECYGSDKVLWNIITGLDRTRYEPLVVMPSDIPYSGELSAALAKIGVRYFVFKRGVVRRRYLKPWGFLQFAVYFLYGLLRLILLAKQHDVALVHSNTSAVIDGFLAAKLLNIPHVWHIHEMIAEPKWFSQLIGRLMRINGNHVVAVSNAVVGSIAAFEDGVTIPIIWNGIDCEKFFPGSGEYFRRQWGIKDTAVVVGVVGRISYWKGQELFIEAAALAAKKVPGLQYVVIGDPVKGDEMRLQRLKEMAGEQGIIDQIQFIQFTSRVQEVMRALDILVLPSLKPESFGLVVLEAMATERPVLASAHGGPLEIVVDGETGLLFPPGDALALGNAISTLAKDATLRWALGKRARQRVLQNFALDKFQQSFREFYDQILTSKENREL